AAEAVLDQPGAAVRALETEAAVAAEGERGIAAAVEEQKRLLAAREALLHRRNQPRGKPAAPLGLLFGEVDGVDRRKLGAAEAGGEDQLLVNSALGHLQALEGGGGAGEDDGDLFEAGAHDGDVAGVVADAVVLLEADFVRLVDDDQAKPLIRKEKCRARADHYLRFSAGDGAPGAAALG